MEMLFRHKRILIFFIQQRLSFHILQAPFNQAPHKFVE
jgi:hypothetical protein